MEEGKQCVFVELLCFDEQRKEAGSELFGQHDLVVSFHMAKDSQGTDINQSLGHPSPLEREMGAQAFG